MSHISYVCIIYIIHASCNGDAEFLTAQLSFLEAIAFCLPPTFLESEPCIESRICCKQQRKVHISKFSGIYWNLDWYWMKLLRKYNKQNPANSISSSTDDCKTYASEKPVQNPALLALALWCRLPSGVWTRAERLVAYFHNSGKAAKAGLSHGLWSHLSHRIAVQHC